MNLPETADVGVVRREVQDGTIAVVLLVIFPFARLSRRRLKRGVFRSVYDLHIAINRFVQETNQMPKPFTWTADPNTIIAAVRRGHQALDSIH